MLKWLFKLFRKKIYYIHSNNILPPPLGEQEEKTLIDTLPEIESRNKLVEHNLRLVVYIAKKFEGTKINIEDLISIGSIGLIKGVQTFKTDKNIKLATYCSRCIENEILMYLRKTSKLKLEVSLDETLNIDRDGNELLLSDVLGTESDVYHNILDEKKEEAMHIAVNKLKPREKEIISLRFGLFNKEMLTQREVALLLGISQSYISRLEKRIIAKLKHELEYKLQIK